MNILVCVKQVPGTSQVEVDPVTGVLKRDGQNNKLNPYDLFALETALRIREEKGHIKHLIQNIGDAEYKLGFIIDPDHDGCCNGVVYYAGTDENGVPHQLIFENMNNTINFDSGQLALEFGMECRLGIWCDPDTQTDYIVLLTEDGRAIDCCTQQELTDFDPETEVFFYYFTENTSSDRDHFYVSYQGMPMWENA